MSRRDTARQLILDILLIDIRLESIPDETSDASVITDDLGLDSLEFIQFIMFIDWHLDTNVPDTEAEKVTTVGDAIELVLRASGRERFARRAGPVPGG